MHNPMGPEATPQPGAADERHLRSLGQLWFAEARKESGREAEELAGWQQEWRRQVSYPASMLFFDWSSSEAIDCGGGDAGGD